MQVFRLMQPITKNMVYFSRCFLVGIIFVTKAGMKRKDIVSALLGILIMAITYWVLFYRLSPKDHKPVKTFSSISHPKNFG